MQFGYISHDKAPFYTGKKAYIICVAGCGLAPAFYFLIWEVTMELLAYSLVGIPALVALYTAIGYTAATWFGDFLAD